MRRPGHASFLVQMEGLNFLTDPVWSERCSPVRAISLCPTSFAPYRPNSVFKSQWVGPKRYRPTPCEISELPEIHFVLISHNHYDHLDALAVEKLGNGPLWIVPKGHLKWFQSMGVTRVVEFEWSVQWLLKLFHPRLLIHTCTQVGRARNYQESTRCMPSSTALVEANSD